MARRINPSANPADDDADELLMPGGAPGIPEAAPTPAAAVKPHAPDPEELAKLPPHKIYRVVREGKILHGGVPAMLKAGKTVSDATHDLQSLRAQGVILEEVQHGH